MVSRICYQIKNEGRKNRDLTFASSMSIFHYGLQNNFITINLSIYLSSIYHDNLELFLIIREELFEFSYSERPIKEAAKYNAMKILTFLLDRDYIYDIAYINDINTVAMYDHFDLMKTLVESDRFKQIEMIDRNLIAVRRLPYSAVLSRNTKIFDCIEDAIFRGDNVKLQNYKESDGKSLCYTCIRNGLYYMFEHLRNKGYIYGEDIADSAALSGNLDCLIKLHKAGFAITSSTLQSANVENHDDVIEYIIHNIEEIEDNDDSWDAMTSLMFRGKLELVKMMVNKGVSIDANYLIKAKKQGHLELVRWVIQEHPDVYLRVARKLFDFVIEEDQN
jgi:hypothetical protein